MKKIFKLFAWLRCDKCGVSTNTQGSCVHCGNNKDFEIWTELEYNDGSDEPTTSNHLINVEFVKCLKCGEIL